MAGRGPQSFKKRQKEQQRKEKQQAKMEKKLQRRSESENREGSGPEMGEPIELDLDDSNAPSVAS
jgi:hypothetical protein